MVHVGSVSVDPPLWLAPMAGVTDRDFRLIVRRIGGVEEQVQVRSSAVQDLPRHGAKNQLTGGSEK